MWDCYDTAGSIYVVEASSIRKYSPDGMYPHFAGKTGPGYENGQGTNASFTSAGIIAFDKAGNLYVHEDLYTLRKITPAGMVCQLLSPFYMEKV